MSHPFIEIDLSMKWNIPDSEFHPDRDFSIKKYGHPSHEMNS